MSECHYEFIAIMWYYGRTFEGSGLVCIVSEEQSVESSISSMPDSQPCTYMYVCRDPYLLAEALHVPSGNRDGQHTSMAS